MKRRRWFEIHSWIGIVTGLLMFLICWSGTVAVLAHEIDWLLDGGLRVPAGTDTPAPPAWGRWADSVRAAFPEATGISLHAPPAAGFAAQAVLDTPAQAMQRVYLDPTTGEIVGERSYFNVQRFFRSLHMSLFDLGSDRAWGYWLVAAFAPLLLLSALAPLLFYRRWWRGFFTLKRDRGRVVFWSDFHKLSGVWGLAFTWLIALTGTWYLVEWFEVDLGYAERTPVEHVTTASALPIDTLIAHARAQWPELDVRSIGLPEGSYWGPVLYLEGQADAWLVRDRANYLMLDPSTGAILQRQDIRETGWPARWIDTVDPLHFGNFAGLTVKLIWFLFGLLLSGLCLTGAYLHAQRLQRESGSRHAGWQSTRGAVWLSAVVLGFASWGAWKEIVGFGPIVDGQQTLPLVPIGVSLFLTVWCIATLAVLVAWAYFVRHRVGGTTIARPTQPRYVRKSSSGS